MNIRKIILGIILLSNQSKIIAQDIQTLVKNSKSKIESVKEYVAVGKLKTNVLFLKIPVASVKLFFKRPNQFKLVSEKGLSFVPKGAMSFNLHNIFSNNDFTVIDAGHDQIDKVKVRIAKLIPNDENSDMVLASLYIDPISSLIIKAKVTTKESGTYEIKMKYKKYSSFGLPDDISFSFNTKDYKLPKGITFDFDTDPSNKESIKKGRPAKGEIKILISTYEINKGITKDTFK